MRYNKRGLFRESQTGDKGALSLWKVDLAHLLFLMPPPLANQICLGFVPSSHRYREREANKGGGRGTKGLFFVHIAENRENETKRINGLFLVGHFLTSPLELMGSSGWN